MTHTTLEDFLDRLRTDAGLRDELRALAAGRAGLPAGEMVSFATARGYRFTVEDVSGELSDRALEAVAGGVLPGDNLPIEELIGGTGILKKPGKK